MSDNQKIKEVGVRIKKLRIFLKYSMEGFAYVLDSSRMTISNYEKGDSLPGGKELILLILKHPEVNLNWVFKGKGKMILPIDVQLNKVEEDKIRYAVKGKDLFDSYEALKGQVVFITNEIARLNAIVEDIKKD